MNTMNLDINLSDELPEDETSRQYYYIEKARMYIQELSQKLGRPLTFCVTTFGCQMNARDSEKLTRNPEERLDIWRQQRNRRIL